MDADGRGYYYILIAAVFLLLLGGCYFACSEIAYASVNKIRLKTLADDGNPKAKKAMYILNHFDKALITILIGNNIMHISCASITTLIASRLWGNAYISVTTFITTLVVFLFSEMIPKSYGKANSEKVTLRFASSLKFLMTILTPLSIFFSVISKVLSKVFLKHDSPTVTEEELHEIIEDMDEKGRFNDDETGDLVQNAMEFDEAAAKNILTSRVDIQAIDINMPENEILTFIKNANHSRIPVYDGDIDKIVGILHIRNYLKEYIKKGHAALKPLLKKPFYVPASTKIDDLFEELTRNKSYMAVVTDEYGGTMGIVTIEDIVEEIVGEIWDEDDEVIENIVPLSDNSYMVLSDTLVEDFFDEIDFACDDEELLNRKTFGAWCGEMFEAIPSVGDSFTYENLTVSVNMMENNRIINIIVYVLPVPEKGDEA